MEEKELKAKDIPWGYALCFNDACGLKDKCMHHQARLLTAEGRYAGNHRQVLSHRGREVRPLCDGLEF